MTIKPEVKLVFTGSSFINENGQQINYTLHVPEVIRREELLTQNLISCSGEEDTMQPLVSVIVPVYRVEDVLARCLDSLCRQSLQNIEILLIDDASPDRCGAICEEYAEKDPRFRVIHHPENRGLSAARNTGIAFASADYLMFVDSDDYVHEDFCNLPYECAVKNAADLVMFLYYCNKKHASKSPGKKEVGRNYVHLSKLEAIELMFRTGGVVVWNKLYRKKLFDTISYPEGYFYEDVGTTHKTILLADSICFLGTVLYYQCEHAGSITTLSSDKVFADYFEMAMQRYHDLAAWGYPEDSLELLLQNNALTYCMRKKEDFEDAKYIFCRKTLQSAKGIPAKFIWKRKILFVLLKYCPPLFDLICVLWGKH